MEFKREMLFSYLGFEMIIRVVDNSNWKGEAFADIRGYENGRYYAYVPEKHLLGFLWGLSGPLD